MRILWVVNIIFGIFCEEFGVKRKSVGGWIDGLANQLEEYKDTYEVGFCFPIINDDHMKDGMINGHKYYSFKFSRSDYRDDVKERFKEIISDFKPDVIHIWGTEYPHTLEMVNACEEMNCIDQALIDIQGLVSIIGKHYFEGVPIEYISEQVDGYLSIEDEKKDFIKRGNYEEEAIRKVKHVMGRTDWDRACTERLNPNIAYHFCAEILRDAFYEYRNTWNYDVCEKYSIFVSQGHYPIKGLHYLLLAMPDILNEYPKAKIYVGGRSVLEADRAGNVSPYGKYINHLIKENNLEGHIEEVGILDEYQMIEMYRRCNVFVLPSSIENSPNSVCEAQLIGCPVVASYVGGVDSILKHNGYSFLYQHDAEYMLAFYAKKIFRKQSFEYCRIERQIPTETCADCLGIYRGIFDGKQKRHNI